MKSEVILTENELPQDVISAIKDGRKLEAIKILRESRGLGLANAKVLVDRASSRLNPKPPISAMFREERSNRGVMKSLLLVTLIAALSYFLVGT